MKHIINGKSAYSSDSLLQYLLNEIQPGSSILDLGCGPKLYSSPFKARGDVVLSVDAWSEVEPDVIADLEKQDILEVIDKQYDYVLMLDFIEHLDKSAGIDLIKKCKTVATKKVILLTPLEQIWDDNSKNVNNEVLWCFGNVFDLHKSLWTLEDFSGWTRIDLAELNDYFVGYYTSQSE